MFSGRYCFCRSVFVLLAVAAVFWGLECCRESWSGGLGGDRKMCSGGEKEEGEGGEGDWEDTYSSQLRPLTAASSSSVMRWPVVK